MANTSSAKKKTRQIQKRTEINSARIKRVRTFLKKAQEAIASGDVDAAKTAFMEAQSETKRGANKGVVHQRSASRTVSRLAKKLKAMSAK